MGCCLGDEQTFCDFPPAEGTFLGNLPRKSQINRICISAVLHTPKLESKVRKVVCGEGDAWGFSHSFFRMRGRLVLVT